MRPLAVVLAVAALIACKDEKLSRPSPSSRPAPQLDACAVLADIEARSDAARQGTVTTAEDLARLRATVEGRRPKAEGADVLVVNQAYLEGRAASGGSGCGSLRDATAKVARSVSAVAGGGSSDLATRAAEAGYLAGHLDELERASAVAGYNKADRDLVLALREREIKGAHAALAAGATGNVRLLDGRSAATAALGIDRELAMKIMLADGFDSGVETTDEPVLHHLMRLDWPEADVLKVVRALLAGGAAADTRGELDVTTLMLACLSDRPEVVRALLAAGADINATDALGRNAAAYAARAKRSGPLLELLRARGATHKPSQEPPSRAPVEPAPLPETAGNPLAFPGGDPSSFQANAGNALWEVRWRQRWRVFDADKEPESAFSIRASDTTLVGKPPALGARLIVLGGGKYQEGQYGYRSGRVEIFEGSGGLWRRAAIVELGDADPASVVPHVAGDIVYVEHHPEGHEQKRRLSVIKQSQGRWKVAQTVSIPIADARISAIDGDTFAFTVDNDKTNVREVHLVRLGAKGWKPIQRLAPNVAESPYFGSRVFFSPKRIVVDARGEGRAGAAYIYETSDGAWTLSTKLSFAELTGAPELYTAAVVGDRIIATPRSIEPGSDIGVLYAFERRDDGWQTVGTVKPGGAIDAKKFSGACAFDGRRVYLCEHVDQDKARRFRVAIAR